MVLQILRLLLNHLIVVLISSLKLYITKKLTHGKILRNLVWERVDPDVYYELLSLI